MWTLWWVWIAAALVLAIVEVAVPGFIFLGFAIGGLVVGLLLLVGGPAVAVLTGSLALTVVVFGVVSAVAWVVLRKAVGVRHGQVRIVDRDVNEN